MAIFHDSPEERTLKELLAAVQQLQGIAEDQAALLQVLTANSLATNQLLQTIVNNTNPTHYSIAIKEIPMAIGTITPGSTGQFGAVLLNNGAPDTSGFVPVFTFTTSDPSATVAPATVDASGGTIPLAQQAVVSIPTGDTLGSVVVTATTTDPTGASQSGSVTVAIGGGSPTAVYTVGVTQLA
jgi:hypothetical protein